MPDEDDDAIVSELNTIQEQVQFPWTIGVWAGSYGSRRTLSTAVLITSDRKGHVKHVCLKLGYKDVFKIELFEENSTALFQINLIQTFF